MGLSGPQIYKDYIKCIFLLSFGFNQLLILLVVADLFA